MKRRISFSVDSLLSKRTIESSCTDSTASSVSLQGVHRNAQFTELYKGCV